MAKKLSQRYITSRYKQYNTSNNYVIAPTPCSKTVHGNPHLKIRTGDKVHGTIHKVQ